MFRFHSESDQDTLWHNIPQYTL